MKIKKILSKILLVLCAISIITLIIVLFSGCTSTKENIDGNLTKYNLNLEFLDESKTLTCLEKVSYINQTKTTLDCVMFHLYPNAFREGAKISPVSLTNEHKAFPNGKSYGKIDITEVKVSGTNCDLILNNENEAHGSTFQIAGEDENILQINLNKEIFPDEKIEIEISFNLTLPNVNHRFGYGNDTVNLGNFYPIACVYENGEFQTDLYHYNGDPFYSEMANYEVSISYPDSYKIATSGTILETNLTNNSLTSKMSADRVRDFAIVLSKKFNVISNMCDDVEIFYYYFSDPQPEKSLEIALKSVKTFNELIGKYPYKTLSVVEANFVHGGMEYPNLIYISNEITDHATYEQVIVHETAHQWWYNLVGNSEYDHGWLDEGLTEYTTVLFYELNPEYDISKDQIIKNAYSNYQLFVEVYGGVYGEIDTSMDRPLNEFKTEPEYVYLTYVKGMLLFDSLREILGDKKFEKCLKEYFEENIYKIAKPEDMISAFESASNMKLENIFNAWTQGKVVILN